jgi:hypothetical protein
MMASSYLTQFEKNSAIVATSQSYTRNLRHPGPAIDGEPRVDYARAESGAAGIQITEGGSGVVT